MFELDTSEQEAKRFALQGNLHSEIRSLAQPLVDQGHSTGIVVGVYLPDGSQQYFSFGSTDQGRSASSAPLNAETLFAVGSISKGFVAALVAELVDEGVFAWDDTLEKLLPEASAFSPDARHITLLQLATHTSGLPRQPFEFEMFKNLVRYTWNGENLYSHIDREYIFNYLAEFKKSKQVEPHYSNIGYGLIGFIVERKTGHKPEALIQEKILTPLGLQQTGYTPERLPGYRNRAHGHAGDQPKFMARGSPVNDWTFTDALRSSAGIYSSAHDLLNFAAAHIQCSQTRLNQLLANNLRPRMERPADAPAIQWVVDQLDGQKITHQVGMVAGYTAYIGVDADRKMAVVVLQNTFNWTDKIGHKLLHRLAAYYDAKQAELRPIQCNTNLQALN